MHTTFIYDVPCTNNKIKNKNSKIQIVCSLRYVRNASTYITTSNNVVIFSIYIGGQLILHYSFAGLITLIDTHSIRYPNYYIYKEALLSLQVRGSFSNPLCTFLANVLSVKHMMEIGQEYKQYQK